MSSGESRDSVVFLDIDLLGLDAAVTLTLTGHDYPLP